MDHLRLKRKSVSDLKGFDRGIVIGTIDGGQIGFLICGTDDFELLLKKQKKEETKGSAFLT
jgi:hypothetical protein